MSEHKKTNVKYVIIFYGRDDTSQNYKNISGQKKPLIVRILASLNDNEDFL